MPDDARIVFIVPIELEENDGVPTGVVHGVADRPLYFPAESAGQLVEIEVDFDINEPDG